MSVELTGELLSYVYVTQDNLNGKTLGALESTRLDLLGDECAHPKIAKALDEVIQEAELGDDIVTRFQDTNKYFFGAAVDSFDIEDGSNAPFKGLLYAEGEGDAEVGFSVVRVAKWVRQAGAHQQALQHDRLLKMMDSMAYSLLPTDEVPVWGIPVVRQTLIKGFAEESVGSTFGFREDYNRVDGLGVPRELKVQLLKSVDEWHSLKD